MPYKKVTEKDANGDTVYCLDKEGGGRVKGSCHKDEAMTDRMMKALYAAEGAAKKAYKDALDGEADAEALIEDELPPLDALTADLPTEDAPPEVEPLADFEPTPRELGFMMALVNKLTEAQRNVSKSVKQALTPASAGTPLSGFKVYKDASGVDRWIAYYSNNFEDRERELFSEKGIDRFVTRVDMGLSAMPELWSWHTPGSRYGQADWVDRIGHYAVATGTYDDTPAGKAGKAYDKAHGDDYEVSHGFLYKQSGVKVVDGKRVYDDFNTFEISPLPRGKAANVFTAFAVETVQEKMEAAVTPEKQAHLVAKFGKEFVEKLITDTETRGKAIEELAGYKDFIHPDDGEGEAEANKEALASAEKAFDELIPQVIEDSGEAVAAALASVKALKQQTEDFAAFKAQVEADMEALRKELLEGAPRRSVRASTDLRTQLQKDDKIAETIEASVKEEKLKSGFLGEMFNGNGNGADVE